MKFAVGYQQTDIGEPFSGIVRDYREAIAEVYFPWPGTASGRASLGCVGGAVDWSAQTELEQELAAIRNMGVKLDLLFNANCYGAFAISSRFRNEIVSILSYLESKELLPEIITTTSPFVAHVVRKEYPDIEIRASVNMRIDSTLAMEYLSALFDSFHIRRDLQRDLAAVKVFHEWCAAHGKKLVMLANSGCLRNCPAQSFHDNLVAHENEIREMDNAYDFRGACHDYLKKEEKRIHFLRDTNFIRPEDVALYDPYFDALKLATRVNRNPAAVVEAYLTHHYRGNLPDLMEPDHAEAFYPDVIENTHLPADFGSHVLDCDHNCEACSYCEEALSGAKVRLNFH